MERKKSKARSACKDGQQGVGFQCIGSVFKYRHPLCPYCIGRNVLCSQLHDAGFLSLGCGENGAEIEIVCHYDKIELGRVSHNFLVGGIRPAALRPVSCV